MSGHSPLLFILDCCPATVKCLDVQKSLCSVHSCNIICPREAIMVPVSVFTHNLFKTSCLEFD